MCPQLPRNFPQTSSGITLHWHGLYMWNDAAWFDGTSYATQCPIAPGTNFTYRFLVREWLGPGREEGRGRVGLCADGMWARKKCKSSPAQARDVGG